ncbi:unnamed protein product [Heligmosomoides polygyrus]|uniref:Gamma-secretase subunit PEN-2 n=1 Tax=Heligmosomoides polygyrus TaxID=6339 RepID=A0A183FL79_HELPZ|nr:unnamed protein product [Heligmosomoides polygyrus]
MDFEEEPQAKTDNEQISIAVVPQQGRFRRAIPCMPIALAGLCCFFNVFIPGLVGGKPVNHTATIKRQSQRRRRCFQLITCPIVVGFVWSVIWGVLFIQIARKWFISSIDNRYSSVDSCPCARW